MCFVYRLHYSLVAICVSADRGHANLGISSLNEVYIGAAKMDPNVGPNNVSCSNV